MAEITDSVSICTCVLQVYVCSTGTKVQILVLPEIADSRGYLFEVVAVQRKEGERSTFRELLQDLVVGTFDSEVHGLVRAETGCGV